MALVLRYAARSDVGLIREGNEDSGYAGPTLLLVADGMGGHAAGELASAIAVATVADIDVHPPQPGEELNALGDSIGDVGDAIAEVIDAEPELTGMGTTITGLYWLGQRLAVVHVGDSRAYLLRDGDLAQITHDHTYVQTLIDAGRITEEEAAFHPRRSLILRALDGMNPVEADLSLREAKAGDRYLLCSDGLSGVVPTAEIAALLSEGDPTGAVTRLVEKALERGAPDNVTVIVADVIDVADDTVADEMGTPVVVGAAGEPRVRLRLPSVRFPDDSQPDPDRPDAPPPFDSGPPTAPQPLIDADIVVPASAAARREAEEQAARRARTRRRWAVAGGLVLAIVAVLAIAAITVNNWVSHRWYVAVNGPAGTGTVAIYQGVQGSLLGFPLSTLSADSGITVSTLPRFEQDNVSKGIVADDEAGAQRIVTELGKLATACQTVLPAPVGCPGSPA
jgi:protein phosphatase